MIVRWIFFLLLFTSQSVNANVAVEQLNALLQKKEAVKSEVFKSEKPSPIVQDLAENYYFVFIYKSTCPHCHNFAPILNDFAKSFDIKVTSYSLDEQSLAGLSAAPLTPELFQTFYVSGGFKPAVPALFLVNRHTLEAYAVLFGEATPYQLARRVNELKQHIEEKFND